MIFDTNVLIALLERPDQTQLIDRLADLRAVSGIRLNEIIFAELSSKYATVDELTGLLAAWGVQIEFLSLAECHRAGVAFAQYRSRGGLRPAMLPDFLIGAQAAERGWPLVTMDRRNFADYFPELQLIDPTRDEA